MSSYKLNVKVESSILIARSSEYIWNFVSDIENDKQWRKGVIDTRWISGEAPNLGATALYIIEGVGEIRWKLVEWKEQRVMAWDYIGGRLDGGQGSYRMEPADGGTLMIMRTEIKAGVIFGLFMKLFVPRQLLGDLKKLKTIMEGNEKNK